MTLDDVITWHAGEAERYVAIARNWTEVAAAEQRRAKANPRSGANGVRAAQFEGCANAAMGIAQRHLDMAHVLTPLSVITERPARAERAA